MRYMRLKKIRELRRLAGEFREKAGATSQADYIRLMTQTAAELDEFADMIEVELGNFNKIGREEVLPVCGDFAA